MIDLAKELSGTYKIRTKSTDAMEVEIQPLPSWSYFAGHFPQMPILPAVAMIDISQYFVQEMEQAKNLLSNISSFRIKNPVVPHDKVLLKIQKEIKDQAVTVAATYNVTWVSGEGDKSLADISLQFQQL
jgi:3-hydroxymyristoyl/3-hydroxydecanoyl-(acyl carrier protein) dehydratase